MITNYQYTKYNNQFYIFISHENLMTQYSYITFVDPSKISSHVITKSSIVLVEYSAFSKLQIVAFQMYSFLHLLYSFGFLQSHRHLSLFYFWFELHFPPSNLRIHLHDICFVNIFGSLIPVIILKTLKFKSSVLFGPHHLLDRSLRALQLSMYLSELNANGW